MPQPVHHPPHIFLDDTWYIITGSIYGGQHMLEPIGYKEFVRDQLKARVIEFELNLAAWVILDNHYHILVKSKFGSALPEFLSRLHGRTSFEINGREDKRGRQVWHNYWDTCLFSERDYWTRFNYIHHNPVKHGYVKKMEYWEFSSYRYYLEHKGTEWMADTWEQYPAIDFTDPRDRF
jgi:putative transposase